MTSTQGKVRERTICRNCMVSCGVFMDIEDGKVVGLIGDKDDPASHGYTCARGRDISNFLYGPGRLMRPLRRGAEGELEETSPETAIREIAERIRAIVDAHGPGSVALYNGTYALAPPASMLAASFMNALQSPMSFSCGSIDQPGKFLAKALHGRWLGGNVAFEDAETWLFIGTNPAVSGLGGVSTVNPNYYLTQAVKRGIQLIVIDPRRTETARKAKIHLHPVPGEDAALLAGMIRVILDEDLHDTEFVEAWTEGIDGLRNQVAPFTPQVVEDRTGVPAAQLIEAARLFAHSTTAGANAGTGSNMSPHGTLAEYLLACMLTICGFHAREGDPIRNPGVLVPKGPRRAQATAPTPAWGFQPRLRTRGLGNTACGLPTAALPDEILLAGEGQIRALICLGGNPLMAWPDQIKTRAALEALDLLVVLDPKRTQTAEFADYVIAPTLPPETPVMTYDFEELDSHAMGWGYPVPYAAYREALVEPPAGSALITDWEFFYELGRELSLEMQLPIGFVRGPLDPPGRVVPLDMKKAPTSDELFDILTEGSRVPLSEVRQHHAGRLYEDNDAVVQPAEAGAEARLSLGNTDMLAQLADIRRGSGIAGDEAFPFRLTSRRTREILNSLSRDQAYIVRTRPHHPAYMHSEDLAELAIEPGDVIAIRSRRATVHALVQTDDDLRRGLVSMSHSYGLDLERLGDGDPGEPQPFSMGNHTGALASGEFDYEEPHSGIPRMSSIPVHVEVVQRPSRSQP